ncbi:MAG: hypothetical protein NUV50_07090, partial [Rhodospirillales bacterium]|nr:hypothetical protein [Rhodospirillales bacterium]
ASLGGDTGNNTQNGSDRSRQKTYTDAQLAGAAKANEEAARTRDKVRSYLGRNGASGTDNGIARVDARAPQQADARQTAEPTRRSEQDAPAAATLARSYAAAKLNENPSAGPLTQKSTPAPSADRYAATPTTTSPKPALASSMRRAQNAAAAAVTAETAATATTPMAPGADPRLSPAATPAQQARNIAQARQFTEQQRAAEANANKVAETSRLRVRDYLGIMSQAPKTPGQSPAATRKAAWHAVTKAPPIPADKADWYNSQPNSKTKRIQFFAALHNAGLSAENIKTYVELLDREGGLVKNPNGSAYGGILNKTLDSLIRQGRIAGIPKGTKPKDLTPSQVADVYKSYFDGTFYAQNGAATLDKIKDLKAKSMLADTLFTRGSENAASIVQGGINAALGTNKHTDNILGSNTLQDYDALTSNSKTRDRLLNAIADHYWSEIEKDPDIPDREKRGWKIRIDSLRP